MKIGIIGGTGSGKTTFIAALKIAAMQSRSGDWIIVGNDEQFEESTALMARNRAMLSRREFPPRTEKITHQGYFLQGSITPNMVTIVSKVMGVKFPALFGRSQAVTYSLEFWDFPGGEFIKFDSHHENWQYLASCNALIYLYDPILDATEGPSNYEYLELSVEYIYQILKSRRDLVNGRLPQLLAVCLSKLDDKRVFDRLRVEHLVSTNYVDQKQVPCINNGRRAFELFADTMTIATIDRLFIKDRSQYFAVSSVGFFENASGVIDLDDCDNSTSTEQSPSDLKSELLDRVAKRYGIDHEQPIGNSRASKIRGKVIPAYVFDPFVWFHSKMLGTNAGYV